MSKTYRLHKANIRNRAYEANLVVQCIRTIMLLYINFTPFLCVWRFLFFVFPIDFLGAQQQTKTKKTCTVCSYDVSAPRCLLCKCDPPTGPQLS